MLKTVSPMAVYDDFAWFYHRYWNGEFHSAAFPILERIFLPRLPDHRAGARRLLRVGLSGRTAYRALASASPGFDASPAMIDLARIHAPDAHFEVADATNFRTRSEIRRRRLHLRQSQPHPDSRRAVVRLRRIAAALKPGAPFAFDVLLEAAYQTDWADNFSLVRNDHVLVISGSGFDFRTRLANCRITTFRRTGKQWRRADTEIQERCYSTQEMDRALCEAGFVKTSCYHARDFGMAGQLGEGRVFYIAEAA
jgi:hypothetical protein